MKEGRKESEGEKVRTERPKENQEPRRRGRET